MGRSIYMVHCVCHTCGWSIRFQGKDDVNLFVSDYHAEDRGTGHAFDGSVAHYMAEAEDVVQKPRVKR